MSDYVPPTKVVLYRDGEAIAMMSYESAEDMATNLALNVNFWGCESRVLNDTRHMGAMTILEFPSLVDFDEAVRSDGQEPVSFVLPDQET